MGLFDLLGKVGKAVSQVQDAIKQVADQVNSQQDVQPAQQQPAPKPQAWQQPAEAPKPIADPHAYFAEILATEFSAYGVGENIPVTDLVGNVADEFQLYKTRPRQVYQASWGAPYTFVLFADGGPKGVVMLGSGHSHDSNVKYLISRMYAKKLGIPYINFYTQMPNERAYVVERIRKFLGA